MLKEWDGLSEVCDTLRSMRARICRPRRHGRNRKRHEMTEYYGHPDILIFGPMAPRTLLFIWAWEAAFGAPAAPCEALVAQYPGEVNKVIEDWADIPAVGDTLRAMRARIAGREALAEIEGKKQ